MSSENEYYGYLEYSEEQYTDYYSESNMENSVENHQESGECVVSKSRDTFTNCSMFQDNGHEANEFLLAMCLPISLIFLFLR